MRLLSALGDRFRKRSAQPLPMEARISRRLAFIHGTALFAGILAVSTLITVVNHRISDSNLQNSQILLTNTLRTQLAYFEFAATRENLTQFNEIINAERMVLYDRYGMMRAQTGRETTERQSDEKIDILDANGEAIGALEIWHQAPWNSWYVNILWFIAMGVTLLISLGLLRRAFTKVLEEEVIVPMRHVTKFIKESPSKGAEAKKSIEKLESHFEFRSIVETYQLVYQNLLDESSHRETQYNLVDQALIEAGISLIYQEKDESMHSATIGAIPPVEIFTAMKNANLSAGSLTSSVQQNCAKYDEITRVHPRDDNKMQTTFQVEVENPRSEYWQLTDIPFPNGVAVLGKDVTASHKAELELRRAQKMEALGVLASGVAHDFNNLLAIVVTSLEMIGMSKTLDKELQELMEQSLAALARASSIARNLLAYGRESTTRLVEVSPDSLFHSLKTMIETGERSAIQYEFHKTSELSVNLDRDLLETALLNLMINSGHAMNDRGRIVVTYRDASIEERGWLSPALRDKVVTIEVRDFGVGIPEDKIDRVCDPFYTTKQGNQGSGLGLSMVSGFAKQFDGAFVIKNRNKGVSAKIVLPGFEPKHLAQIAKVEKLSPNEFNGIVLIVDDNQNLLTAIEKSMLLRGYACLKASSCQEAIGIIQNTDTPIDVLVTDLNLTDGNGIEVAREYRKRCQSGRVILISGNAEIKAEDNIFDHILQKPFSLRQLFYSIEGLIPALSE